MEMRTMVRSIATVLVCAGLVAGCASMGGKPSDEEMIRATVMKVKEALETKNIDLLMETFAEDFEHPQVGGKAEARDLLSQGLNSGYADNGEVSIEQMKITMSEDKTSAAVYPLDLSSSAGAVAAELVLEKGDGSWLVKTINVDGV